VVEKMTVEYAIGLIVIGIMSAATFVVVKLIKWLNLQDDA